MGEIPLREKIDLLKTASLFSSLMEMDLEVVARYSEYLHYNKGEIIFSEGSQEDGLYIIKEGEALITKHKDDDKEINIARFISGECFGEMELLKNTPRNATAIAEEETTLLRFPKKGIVFRDVLQKYPEISARILHTLLGIIASRIRNTNRLITEKSPWIRDLRRQLYSDQLTGLYNRSFLHEDFATLLPEYGENTSLIMIKPDNFKVINDKYGHDAGDKVLRMMAIFVQSILREDDVGVRYRGDEFVAILPDTGLETAFKIAGEINTTLFEMDISHITSDINFNVTFSIGIAVYPIHANESAQLIKLAYEKMFEARRSGGNRIISV
ncbi:MAG: GGDEF domain-containing protein [Spirochaetota bacterium]|nr:GGDEF domain-containing protein [Spirochaetota bacterium]